MFGLDIGTATIGLAMLAGVVTTLSPCVLPILPMVAAAATGRHRAGLPMLALGLATAFTVVGVAVASSGHLLGIDERSLRLGAGVLMALVGAVLVSEALQRRFEVWTAGLANTGHGWLGRIASDHPLAQFAIGALMGVAWSPCIGPTLGAAIALAATGGGTAEAAVTMASFSVAAVVPLAAAGLASRSVFIRRRDAAARIGRVGRRVAGWTLLGIGLLVLTGIDKALEAWLLDHAPTWLIDLTTRF